ncbi:GcrA family cell cycle regulator [Brevundimonas sp.]
MTERNKPALSAAQVAEALKAYAGGETSASIGLRLDRSDSTICALMRAHGVKRPRKTSRHADPAFLSLRRSGKSAPEIAEALGDTVKAVENWITLAIKAGLITKVGGGKDWTPEDDAHLKRLWATKGPAEISRETGWSDAQITRRARHLSLPKKGYPLTRKAVVGRKITPRKQAAAEKAARAVAREAAIEARKAEAASMWSPRVDSRPFLQRPDGGCRWPLGDGADSHACSRPVEGRESYCPHHRMLAGGGRTQGYAATAAPRGRGRASVFDRGHAA